MDPPQESDGAPARRRPESQKDFLPEGASSSGCARNAGVPTSQAAAQGRRWPGRRHAEERQHLEPTREGNLSDPDVWVGGTVQWCSSGFGLQTISVARLLRIYVCDVSVNKCVLCDD